MMSSNAHLSENRSASIFVMMSSIAHLSENRSASIFVMMSSNAHLSENRSADQVQCCLLDHNVHCIPFFLPPPQPPDETLKNSHQKNVLFVAYVKYTEHIQSGLFKKELVVMPYLDNMCLGDKEKIIRFQRIKLL